MSQVSGSIVFEFPTERVARLVAAEIVEHLDRVDLVGAIAAAVARHLAEPTTTTTKPAEPGGYPLGRHHAGPGSYDYDRGADL